MLRRSPRAAGLAILAGLHAFAMGCESKPALVAEPYAPGPDQPRHAVQIRTPTGPPTIATGMVDERGEAVTVACAACHATKPANESARINTPLQAFHQHLHGQHGTLTCISCHNPADGYATLRLADGRAVPYADVMTLCAQCHGPQHRDYLNGAHGGMTGHWDLTKGGRVRNNCVDCHAPHTPKYPAVLPAPGPKDRNSMGGSHE